MHERGIGGRRALSGAASVHRLSASSAIGEGDFPNAERIGRETVTLPLFPAMELADVDRVCAAAREVLAQAGRVTVE